MRKVSRPEIDSKIEADKNKKDAHPTHLLLARWKKSQ
jgi:hypothetical protein